RVLNEGIDVPEARVAIIVAGGLGARGHVPRIGRVPRPGPGKHAPVYQLITTDTPDSRRASLMAEQAPPPSPCLPAHGRRARRSAVAPPSRRALAPRAGP